MVQRRHSRQILSNNISITEMGRGHEGRISVGAAQVVKRDTEHRLVGARGRGAQVRRGGAERVPVQLMCL